MATDSIQLKVAFIGLLIPGMYCAENLTVLPKVSFLQDDRSVTLVWRYHSEALSKSYFGDNFIFYHNGSLMEKEGGGASFVYPGEPFVDYELERIKEPGVYIGKVGQLNATAFVYYVEAEAPVQLARDGVDFDLKCKVNLNASFTRWEVDGNFTDQLGDSKFIRNIDGALTVKKIDFNDAFKKIRCHLFVSQDDLLNYMENEAIHPYKTAIITTPVLVYKAVKESNSTCIIKTYGSRDISLVRICYPQNGTRNCKHLTANSSVELSIESKFFFLKDDESIRTDFCKVQWEEDHSTAKQGSSGTSEVVIAVIVIACVLISCVILRGTIVVCRRTSIFMNKNDNGPNTTGTRLSGKETETEILMDGGASREVSPDAEQKSKMDPLSV